jgi:hypothetical protein
LIVSDAGGAADTSEIQIGALSGTMPDSLGSNLVTNPSFEIDLAGWAGYNSAVLSRVAGGLSSNYCAQLKGPLTYGTFGINDSPNWVGSTVAGKKYRVSAAARSTGVAGRVRIQVREWKNGVQQGSTVFSQYVRLNDVWQTLTMDVLAFTSGGALDIQVVDEPALGGELMYIDDISVRMVGSKTVQNVATPDGTPDEVVFGRPTLWPNPMLRRARISFATSREGPLEIDVFDLSGRRMRTLMRAPSLPPGRHEFEFNGRDDNDARIVPGVYFYRVRSANGETDGRFVIAR